MNNWFCWMRRGLGHNIMHKGTIKGLLEHSTGKLNQETLKRGLGPKGA